MDFSITLATNEATTQTPNTSSAHDSWQVLRVAGEIDMATAPRFRQKLMEVMDNVSSNVVLDLCEVSFIDSTGLGVLIGASKRARTAGGDIRLVQGSSRLAELLEITRLNRVMHVFESVEQATQTEATNNDFHVNPTGDL